MSNTITKSDLAIMTIENVERRILLIRVIKIILGIELAELFGVETKQFNRAIRRNMNRFPPDFMFRLSKKEFENLRCQIGTSSWGGHRYTPYVFTEHGVAMLASILRSKKAVKINIFIVRAFVRLRELLATHKDLARKIESLERGQKENKRQITAVYLLFKKLMDEPIKPKWPIGFSR